MIMGVLQQLRIVERNRTRLILRELPLLEWIFAFALVIVAFNLLILNVSLTAVASIVAAVLVVLLSRIRFVIFDAEDKAMRIEFQYPLLRRVVNRLPLIQVERVILREDPKGPSQIIMLTQQGELGLSVYSRDPRPWKQELCQVINAWLDHVKPEMD